MKQHNAPKWPQNSYIFLILEPIDTFVHCKRCSPPNMANKMSLNSYLDHHICLIFQIWLHNNASWQKGHLIVHWLKNAYNRHVRSVSHLQNVLSKINISVNHWWLIKISLGAIRHQAMTWTDVDQHLWTSHGITRFQWVELSLIHLCLCSVEITTNKWVTHCRK